MVDDGEVTAGRFGQQDLMDDHDRLIAYGTTVPADWGGLWFEGPRLVAAFINPDAHRDIVRKLVKHPDRVSVVLAVHSRQRRDEVRQAVNMVLAAHPDTWQGIGNTAQRISVDLLAAGLPLAAQLHHAYGDLLDITVAGHKFPLDERAVADQPYPAASIQTAPWPEGLQAAIRLDEKTPVSGSLIRGRLILRATSERVHFESDQPLYGELINEQNSRLNSLDGFRMGTGWSWRLEVGQESEVAFTVSTAAARLADGPHVPPGRWRLILPVPVHDWPTDGSPSVTTELVAGPFELVLRSPGDQRTLPNGPTL